MAVIGAGPIGLSAALQLVAKGETPLIFEAGDHVGASIREWAHVRLFSPWKYLVDPTAREALQATGWRMPNENALPTGGELVVRLLQPLARLPQLAPHIRLGHRVLAVTRRGYDKVKTAGRNEAPFELVVLTPFGTRERVLARAVIDASGTWASPNPMGAGGVAAEGEAEIFERALYGIPDALGRDRARYERKRVLVVGSGHSAFNALLDLAELRRESPGTEIVWAIRRSDPGLMFGGGRKDALEARGALGDRLQALISTGFIRMELGVRISRVTGSPEGVVVESDTGARFGPFDEVIVTTGFRPDLSLGRELRLRLDPWLEAPEQLAPLIDPNLHSCGTVYPHGAAELAHPEKDYYVVGMKSYGRAPTFLMLTGYEQVRSVVCALVGDEAGGRDVQLVLPETGVCQTDLGAGSCCSVSDDESETGASCGTAEGAEEDSSGEAVLVGVGADPEPAAAGCCR
ncbi:MAG TPA: NAD(P)-binding domain-containing protein [Gemmatimonadaceae bacterium]|nr:NAD(P)-binding domain-containing protein [Gemmatimonadaceae bacterium]